MLILEELIEKKGGFDPSLLWGAFFFFFGEICLFSINFYSSVSLDVVLLDCQSVVSNDLIISWF